MVTVTKKHQTSLALIAVVFATAMVVGTLASTGDNMVFATHGKKAVNKQSISQACDQDQSAPVTTAGAISPPILAGINAGLCLNLNGAGNAATQNQETQ